VLELVEGLQARVFCWSVWGVGFILMGVGEMGVKELWVSGCDMWGLVVMVVSGVFLGDRFVDNVVPYSWRYDMYVRGLCVVGWFCCWTKILVKQKKLRLKVEIGIAN